MRTIKISDLNKDLKQYLNQKLKIKCMIKSYTKIQSKKGNLYARIEINDETGEYVIYLFGESLAIITKETISLEQIEIIGEVHPKRFNKKEFEFKLSNIC